MNRLFKGFAIAAAAFALAVPAICAEKAIKVDVPFAFVAGNETMPAGEYVVQAAITSSVVKIMTPDYRVVSGGLANPVQGALSGKARLVFHKYGDQYFLSQIWTVGQNTGWQLPKSRLERELVKSAAAPVVTVLALR